MSQTIDIFSRQVIENQSNMAENDILNLGYVPEKTSRLEKAVADVSSAEAKPVQASKDAIGKAVSTIQEGDFIAYDVVKRIKSMANLDVCDRELAKIGHLKFYGHDVPEVQITVTTYPIDGLWEDVVLRILTA